MERKDIMSKVIRNLRKDLLEDNIKNIQKFWENLNVNRTPIVEKIEGDKEHVLITFIFKGNEKTENVILFGGFIEYIPDNYDNNKMYRLLGSDIWYRTYKVRNDIKCNYNISENFLVDGVRAKEFTFIEDSFGTRFTALPKDEENKEGEAVVHNLIEMENSLKDYWTIPKKEVKKGEVQLHRIKNEKLKIDHRVWVYLPAEYSKEGTPFKCITFTDGFSYKVTTPTLLDNMINEGEIEPLVGIFIDCEGKRSDVLRCDDGFCQFIIKSVLAECREKYNISLEREDNLIGGISLGGLFAGYMGLKYPEVFGKVLTQSASNWWFPEYEWGQLLKSVNYDKLEWISKQYFDREKWNQKFYIEVGTLEGELMMKVNKELGEVLISKGYDIEFSVFQGAHDYLSWKETLAKGLKFLFPKNKIY